MTINDNKYKSIPIIDININNIYISLEICFKQNLLTNKVSI